MLKRNWFKVSHTTLEDPRFLMLTPSAQMLYIFLSKLKQRSVGRLKHLPGWIQFSDKELSGRLYYTPRTIFRARQALYVNGFIRYQTTPNHKACRYYVHDEPPRVLP
jgi:hypothetical protein